MPRILVWNSTGLPPSRQTMLRDYVVSQAVDVIILIEGGSNASFPGPTGAATAMTSVHERCDDPTRLQLRETVYAESVMAAKLGNTLAANGGVGALKYYALYGNGLVVQSDDGYVSYENLESDVRDWILEPCLEKIRVEPPVESGRRVRTRLDLDAEARITQSRANFLGHRRPKTVTIGGLTIYFWHAPLGQQSTPHDAAMQGLSGTSSGGPDAKYHNYLFKKHIENLAANEILVGDLNIGATAVREIYGIAPAATSADGWCHVVPGAGVAVTNVVTPAHDHGTMGDHAPIICTLA